MPLTTNFVRYTTDDGLEIIIAVKYENDNDLRLTTGNFTSEFLINAGCKAQMPRKQLKPRYIDTLTLGRIYFRTHQAWLEYIEPNRGIIKSVQGESISCTGLNVLYN